jgi:hypothetical protein
MFDMPLDLSDYLISDSNLEGLKAIYKREGKISIPFDEILGSATRAFLGEGVLVSRDYISRLMEDVEKADYFGQNPRLRDYFDPVELQGVLAASINEIAQESAIIRRGMYFIKDFEEGQMVLTLRDYERDESPLRVNVSSRIAEILKRDYSQNKGAVTIVRLASPATPVYYPSEIFSENKRFDWLESNPEKAREIFASRLVGI